MQTFLPYPSFEFSLRCLDPKRLGKQRVEAYQVICVIADPSIRGWQHHPAVTMWRPFVPALIDYYNTSIAVWLSLGYRNSMTMLCPVGPVVLPSWLGDPTFHASHRSNLLRKRYDWYSRFGWSESTDLPYVWPTTQTAVNQRTKQ